MLFVPYDIEALYEHRPMANWAILGKMTRFDKPNLLQILARRLGKG